MTDSQVPIEHWGWAVHTAVYLHRRTPNESLCLNQQTPNESLHLEKRQHTTPYEMLYNYGKPTHTTDKILISYAPPLHHLRRFGCWVSRQIPEPRRTDSKFGARSKPQCMMVGYVHGSTTLWKIWDPDERKVKTQSEVIFDEERNAYTSEPYQPYQLENRIEEADEQDIFGLKLNEPRQVEYIEESPEAHSRSTYSGSLWNGR